MKNLLFYGTTNYGESLNSSNVLKFKELSKNFSTFVMTYGDENKRIEHDYVTIDYIANFEDELKVILDLYAKMVSEGSWKDYGLNISSKQVGFSVFKNAAENALYRICKNFKPKNKNLKYLITDTNGKILKNSFDLNVLLKNTNWKKLQK